MVVIRNFLGISRPRGARSVVMQHPSPPVLPTPPHPCFSCSAAMSAHERLYAVAAATAKPRRYSTPGKQ
jgi:hypothetical protein